MSLLLKVAQMTDLQQKFCNYFTYLVGSVNLTILAEKFF